MNDAVFATVVRPLLISAVLPAAAAAIGVGAAQLARRRPWSPRSLVGLGLGLGLVLAFVLVAGRPAWPPRDVLHWLPFALGAAWLLGTLDGLRSWPALPRLGAHALLLAGTVGALLQPLARRWPAERTVLWLAALGGGALVLWWLLDRPARRRPLPLALVPLLFAAGSFAGAMALSGSAKSAQLAGALAAGLGALTLAALAGKLERFDGAPLAVAVSAYSGVVAHALLFTEVHPLTAGMSAAAALTGGMGRLPLLGLLPSRKLLMLALLAAALPAIAALLFAWSRFEPSPYGAYGGG